MWGWILITLGIITFFIGFFFSGASSGQNVCISAGGVVKDKTEIEGLAKQNFGGGVAGIVIGLVFLVIGVILRYSELRSETA